MARYSAMIVSEDDTVVNLIMTLIIMYEIGVKMANRRVEKVPLDPEWFKWVLRQKRVSVRSLGDEGSVNYVGWHERTIRRAMLDGAISPKLLDAIARKLDVYPPYLSGTEYAPALGYLDDEDDREYLRSTYLSPEKHPYSMKLQEELGTYRHVMNTLMMHGVDENQFAELDDSERRRLFMRLDNAVTGVLLDFFPDCRRLDSVDEVREWDWTSKTDVYDAMLPHWEETGNVVYD